MIEYIHKVHPRSSSLKLKIESDGQVYVISPQLVPKFIIEQFVRDHQGWIETTQAKLLSRRAKVTDEIQVSIFGKKYAKEVTQAEDMAQGVTLKASTLFIKLPAGKKLTSAALKTTLDRFLKATAEKYLVPRTHQLAKIMQITFGFITLREQKSRWGSCSSQGNLNFNWRLVHYPPEIIDYVIIHELAHRREMNHSSAFWEIVRQYDPASVQHRGWLKRNGLSVH